MAAGVEVGVGVSVRVSAGGGGATDADANASAADAVASTGIDVCASGPGGCAVVMPLHANNNKTLGEAQTHKARAHNAERAKV